MRKKCTSEVGDNYLFDFEVVQFSEVVPDFPLLGRFETDSTLVRA